MTDKSVPMATVNDILAKKGSQVLSIDPQSSAHAAVLVMNTHNVGALVVLDDLVIVGLFTERDLMRRVVCERRDASATRVADVMTRNVCCARTDMTIEEARAVMKERRVRHLPILSGSNRLVGVVSIGDLNAWEIEHQEMELQYLHEYLYGQVA